MLHERLGKLSFVLLFIGFNLTLLPPARPRPAGHAAADRHLRRPTQGWNFLNLLSTIGAYIIGLGVLPLVWNIFRSFRKGEIAGDNPWDGQTLEWATARRRRPSTTSSRCPPIRSERPLWDANHPDQLTKVGH